ncbi:MAG: hypothetical protein FK733_18490 [Asgard group archaeon]|nr:hypothetical protein [Asgard group archaeon]
MSEKIKALKEKYESKISSKDELEKYSNELTNLVFKFQQEDKIEGLMEIVDIYEKLLVKNPDNQIIQNHYGQTILNSLPLFFTKLTPTEILDVVNTLRSHAYDSKQFVLLEYLVMTLVNLIYDFSLIQRLSSIREFTMELIDLSRKHQNKERIEIACAKGLMNATMIFLQNNNKDSATDCYKAMRKIMDRYPEKDMVDTMQLQRLKEILE